MIWRSDGAATAAPEVGPFERPPARPYSPPDARRHRVEHAWGTCARAGRQRQRTPGGRGDSRRHGCRVTAPYLGTRGELLDLVALAGRGELSIEVETYSIEDTPTAYERLSAGLVRGRAVVVPS